MFLKKTQVPSYEELSHVIYAPPVSVFFAYDREEEMGLRKSMIFFLKNII